MKFRGLSIDDDDPRVPGSIEKRPRTVGPIPMFGRIISLKIEPSIRQRVDELARAKSLTRSEVLRRLIRKGLAS